MPRDGNNIVPMLRATLARAGARTERQNEMVNLALGLKLDAGNMRGQRGCVDMALALLLEAAAGGDLSEVADAAGQVAFEIYVLQGRIA